MRRAVALSLVLVGLGTVALVRAQSDDRSQSCPRPAPLKVVVPTLKVPAVKVDAIKVPELKTVKVPTVKVKVKTYKVPTVKLPAAEPIRVRSVSLCP